MAPTTLARIQASNPGLYRPSGRRQIHVIHRRRHIRAINTRMRRHAVCARVEKSTTIRRCVCGITDTVPRYGRAWGRRVRVWVLKRCSTLWAYYNCDTSTIRVRFEHDSATTRYNTLRGFSCARIRDRFEHSTRISGRRVLHVD